MQRRPLRVRTSDRQRPSPVPRPSSRASASKLVSHVASSHPPCVQDESSSIPPATILRCECMWRKASTAANALLYIQFPFILMNELPLFRQ